MSDVVLEREVSAQVTKASPEALVVEAVDAVLDAAAVRRTPHWLPLAGAAGAIVAAAPFVLWVCAVAHPHPMVHAVGLFVHLAALIVGFGAVLSVDWVAALFMLGKRQFRDVMASAENAAVPIWVGYAGLVLSGLVLEPDLGSAFTQVKLALVLVVGLNGLVAVGLHRALCRRGEMAWLVVGTLCATVSQLGWWGATIVGFVNAH